MSFGRVQIPAQYEVGVAAGDPLLNVLLDFAQTVINEYCGDAWRAVLPGPDSRPVRSVFTAWPSRDVKFSDKHLPALFLEREYTEPTEQIGADMVVARSVLRLLWIYQGGSTAHLALRAPFWNVVDKTLRSAIEVGKDRNWVVPGDTYYSPEFWGSSLLRHTQCTRITVGRAQQERIDIDYVGQRKADAPGYLGCSLKINITERSVPDGRMKRVPHQGLGVTLNGPKDDAGQPLIYQVASFGLRVNTVLPNSGPSAGGTVVTLTGLSFTGDTRVLVDGVEAETTAASINELSFITPAHAAGTVGLVVTNPGDESVTLANAFTFT